MAEVYEDALRFSSARAANFPELGARALAGSLQDSSAMRTALLLALLTFSGACVGDGGGGTTLPLFAPDAIVENGLPYDGCSWVIHVDDRAFAPDAASLPDVQAFATAIGNTHARIEYELTGGSAHVECGWRTTQSYPEMTVLAIDPP
jgi:hypothetical protein